MTNLSQFRKGSLLIFVCIFALSGFSGLIYESIWSHYLKLFLGHSSYAQVLVLSIFMGGLAIGSAIAARLSIRLTNLILGYGICEGIIGLFGVTFHVLFINVETLAFESLFPALGSSEAVHTAKWTIGALLILPQSILLGATFPFLATGLLRRFPEKTGKTLATLYFINSLGAAVGILANAFWLIPAFGLPGAILTAGLINIFIALIIYCYSKGDNYPSVKQMPTQIVSSRHLPVLLWVAAFTGLASFMYEIAWIRMLSMVLGSSTHSFEIMLSSFILGLALGSLIIRKYIDTIANPIVTLGAIQIVMGILAVLTIPLYNQTFELMIFVHKALDSTDAGYVLFVVFSLIISMVVMLPATVCAGTTLPLVTHILLKNGSNDKAIGKVYAYNTLGSIVGIVLASQIVMPWAGLQSVIIIGALVDVCLGLYLLNYRRHFLFHSRAGQAVLISLVVVLLVLPFVDLNTSKMSSGVYRHGEPNAEAVPIFYVDGKTSSVAIKEFPSGIRVITTNGKPDASAYIHGLNTKTPILGAAKNMSSNSPPSNSEEFVKQSKQPTTLDQSTMVLLGVLPYVYHQNVKDIANIGFGSGITTHTLLHHPDLKKLDTIEIEQAVIDAAKYFRPNIDNVFTDDRSTIHVEDAKTFFATAQKKYDVIVSEPSNPWVSGVAGLFTQEFYTDVNRYLDDNSIFVQWLQLYEISQELVGTVYAALSSRFEYIHLYKLARGDMAFVASRSPLVADYSEPFKHNGFSDQLGEVSIDNPSDIEVLKLGERNKLNMIFDAFTTNVNSDYFPILDVGAARSRYKGSSSTSLFELQTSSSINYLSGSKLPKYSDAGVNPLFEDQAKAANVNAFFNHIDELENGAALEIFSDDEHIEKASNFYYALSDCRKISSERGRSALTMEMIGISNWAFPYTTKQQLTKLMSQIVSCEDKLTDAGKNWLAVNRAWIDGDMRLVKEISGTELMKLEKLSDSIDLRYLNFNLTAMIALREFDDFELIEQRFKYSSSLELETLVLFHVATTLSNRTTS